MTALSRRNLANFQPIFILRLAANNKTLTNCDGEADGKVVTFGSTAHFNAKSFTVVTTKEIGEDMLQQILEVEYPFKRLVIDIIDNSELSTLASFCSSSSIVQNQKPQRSRFSPIALNSTRGSSFHPSIKLEALR